MTAEGPESGRIGPLAGRNAHWTGNRPPSELTHIDAMVLVRGSHVVRLTEYSSACHDDIVGTLELPRAVAIQTSDPISEVAGRLSVWLSTEPGIEKPMAHAASDRYVTGHVDGAHVHAAVRDSNDRTRRKNWNVEFEGSLETAGGATILRGTIDVPDRRQLRIIVWMLRLSAVVPVLFTIREGFRGGPALLPSVILTGVIVLGVAAGTWALQALGERDAARDAALMLTALDRLFE